MAPVYIDCIMKYVPDVEGIREPRSRFMHYYRDLYKMFSESLDERTFYQGGQHCFAELCEGVLEKFEARGKLSDVDLLLICHRNHEFDPQVSFAAYLKERFQLSCDIMDVCDQGSLAHITGVTLVQQTLAAHKAKKIVLVKLESSTVPRGHESTVPVPKRSMAVGMLLENKHHNHYQSALLSAAIVNGTQRNEVQHIAEVMQDTLADLALTEKEVGLFVKPCQAQDRVLNYFKTHTAVRPLDYTQVVFYDVTRPHRAWFVLEKDDESEDMGFVLLTHQVMHFL